MTPLPKGFSLVELLVSMCLALALAAIMFQLFHQSERVIRDQTVILEMQQTARIVASQIADEVRMAGQGVPLFAASFDTTQSEAVAVFLGSSTANRIDFRAGLSLVETIVTTPAPITFQIGVARSLSVESGSGFSAGRFVYISGPAAGSAWTWLRAEVMSVGWTSLTVTPQTTGSAETKIEFAAPPSVALEEAVSVQFSGGSVRRTTANSMNDAANPTWFPANEIGRSFTALAFIYYDSNDNPVNPVSLADRMNISRVDIQLTVEASSPLRDGSRPRFSLAFRSFPRNVKAVQH